MGRPLILAFIVVILLRSRSISLSKHALDLLRNVLASSTNLGPSKAKVDQEELDGVLQQVYIDEPDGSKTLLVPYRERIVMVCLHQYYPCNTSLPKGYNPTNSQLQVRRR